MTDVKRQFSIETLLKPGRRRACCDDIARKGCRQSIQRIFTRMTRDEAIDLIRPAVAGHDGDWADLGAGTGTFTAALAQLPGAPHTVTAVERDVAALAELRHLATSLPRTAAAVYVLAADLADPAALDAIAPGSLAGVLFGNARANPWVPHPVSLRRLSELADAAGLGACDVVSERTSRYQGTLYCAVLRV